MTLADLKTLTARVFLDLPCQEGAEARRHRVEAKWFGDTGERHTVAGVGWGGGVVIKVTHRFR